MELTISKEQMPPKEQQRGSRENMIRKKRERSYDCCGEGLRYPIH